MFGKKKKIERKSEFLLCEKSAVGFHKQCFSDLFDHPIRDRFARELFHKLAEDSIDLRGSVQEFEEERQTRIEHTLDALESCRAHQLSELSDFTFSDIWNTLQHMFLIPPETQIRLFPLLLLSRAGLLYSDREVHFESQLLELSLKYFKQCQPTAAQMQSCLYMWAWIATVDAFDEFALHAIIWLYLGQPEDITKISSKPIPLIRKLFQIAGLDEREIADLIQLHAKGKKYNSWYDNLLSSTDSLEYSGMDYSDIASHITLPTWARILSCARSAS